MMTEQQPRLTPELIHTESKRDALKIAAELEQQILRDVTYERVREQLLQNHLDGQGCRFAFLVTPTRTLPQGEIRGQMTESTKDYLRDMVDLERYQWQLCDDHRTTGHLFVYLKFKPAPPKKTEETPPRSATVTQTQKPTATCTLV